MMNYIWLFFIVSSVAIGLYNGKMPEVSEAVLKSSATAVEISLGLIGIMSFWLGLMHIAQKAGLLDLIAKVFPRFCSLYSRQYRKMIRSKPI